MRIHRDLLLALLLGLSAASCTSAAPATACVPGASVACVGSGACAGHQVCVDDGSRLGPCVCGGVPDGAPDSTLGDTSGDTLLEGGADDAGYDTASDAGYDTAGDASFDASYDAAGDTATPPADAPAPSCDAASDATSCDGGRCVTTLSGVEARPLSLHVVDSDLYWLGTNVTRYPQGADCPLTLATSTRAAVGPAVAGDQVFFGDVMAQQIRRVAKTGGAATTVHTGAENLPELVGGDAAYVYWSDMEFSGSTSFTMRLRRLPVAGGTPTTIWSGDYPWVSGASPWLKYDGKFVYVTPGNGTLFQAPVAGGPSRTITTSGATDAGIKLDDLNIYWFSADGSASIMKAPIAGGGEVRLTMGQIIRSDYAVDGAHLYFWLGSDLGHPASSYQLVKMPRDGGGLITLWTTTAAPGIDIAVDANSVYWLDSNGRPTRLTPK